MRIGGDAGWRGGAGREGRLRPRPPSLSWACPVAVAAITASPLHVDEQVAPCVRYRLTEAEAHPWLQGMHVLEIDRDAAGVSFVASVGPAVRGPETVAELARTHPAKRGRVLAAINGDFFQIGGAAGPRSGTATSGSFSW